MLLIIVVGSLMPSAEGTPRRTQGSMVTVQSKSTFMKTFYGWGLALEVQGRGSSGRLAEVDTKKDESKTSLIIMATMAH